MFAALSILLKFKWAFHEPTHCVGKESGKFIKPFEFLPIALGQLRFIIPRIDLTGATINEKPNN